MTEEIISQENENPSFDEVLVGLAADIPEIADNQDTIGKVGREFIVKYQIDPEFFSDKARVIIFAALAQRRGLKLAGHEGDTVSVEEDFIHKAIMLLLLDKTPLYADYKTKIDAEDVLSPETESGIYERFTHPGLTAELRKAIAEGLIDDVKTKLGITPDNEQPYELRVLSIGNQDTAAGMQPPISEEMKQDHNHPNWPATHEAFELYKRYINGLENKTEAFSSAVGRADQLPAAWISHVGSRVYLCMPQPYAEKLLHTDQPRANYYTEDNRQRDLAILEHEYVHTQRGLALDGKLFYGIGFEERRAEYFSGDKQGYQDIKGFFIDIATINGIYIPNLLARGPLVEKAEVYTELCKRFGLQGLLDLSLICPVNYLSDTRPLQKEVVGYLDGFDGFCKRLYDQEVSMGRKDQITARIRQRAAKFVEQDLGWINDYRKKFGLNVVSDLVANEMSRMKEPATTLQ